MRQRFVAVAVGAWDCVVYSVKGPAGGCVARVFRARPAIRLGATVCVSLFALSFVSKDLSNMSHGFSGEAATAQTGGLGPP